MLTSITPLGERGRASRWRVTTTAYVLGSTAGGLAVGLAAGLLGLLLPLEQPLAAALAGALVVAAAAAALLVELGRVPLPPGPRRQVDEDWLHRYRGWVYGAGYGAQLGLGVVTIITSTTLHVALLLAVLTGSPAGGAAVGAVFGLARALPVLTLRHVHTGEQLRTAARRVESLGPLARRVAASTLALVAVAVTGQLVTTAMGSA